MKSSVRVILVTMLVVLLSAFFACFTLYCWFEVSKVHYSNGVLIKDVKFLQGQLSDSMDRNVELEMKVGGGLEERHKNTLQRIVIHSQESTDQVLEIHRLQDELRKADEGKDVWPCGTIKEPNELIATFPELVEKVIDGVVHISMGNGGQASGFVIGPRLIKTARHVTRGQTAFTLFTNDGHVIKATRAISHKGSDTGYIYIDDLTCVAEAAEDISCRKGNHEVELKVLELGSIKDCKLGQEVFSIGSTDGIANFNAVAKGIIQTLNNKLVEHVLELGGYGWEVLFSMTPEGGGGNSGCPVFTMDGKVVGVWVGSNQSNLHYAIPVDVFVEDIDAVMLMFTQDKYQVEKAPDTRMDEMQWQIANLQQQASYLQQDNEDLLEMYEWFLENKESLGSLKEVVENLIQEVYDLDQWMENLMRSVTLREYLNL